MLSTGSSGWPCKYVRACVYNYKGCVYCQLCFEYNDHDTHLRVDSY